MKLGTRIRYVFWRKLYSMFNEVAKFCYDRCWGVLNDEEKIK